MDYIEIYKKRLNRYGLDYQSRIQGQRERDFDSYLLKSIYRVDFWYENSYEPATLERYKQDETQTLSYLLTRRETMIPNGTVLTVENTEGEKKEWMIWWLENIEASGYNRYIVLKMTHELSWVGADGQRYKQWAYFSGPGTSKITDTVKSSTGDALYKQNDNLHLFITPYCAALTRDTYTEVPFRETTTAYVVSEVDVNSTPGVMYVSVDPSYLRDKTVEEDVSAEQYWLNGGK